MLESPTQLQADSIDLLARAERVDLDPAQPDMYDVIVVSDDDLIGRVAFSIFEQHRNDWRAEFQRTNRRMPNAHEETTYVLGENTKRRLINYRYLAEARLAGRLSTGSARDSFIVRSLRKAMAHRYRAI